MDTEDIYVILSDLLLDIEQFVDDDVLDDWDAGYNSGIYGVINLIKEKIDNSL